MNKIMKIILSSAAACLVLGIAVSAIGFFIGGSLPASMRRTHDGHRLPERTVSQSASAAAGSASEASSASLPAPESSSVSADTAPSAAPAAPDASAFSNAPSPDTLITSLDFELGGAEIYLVAGDKFDLQVEGSPRFENRVVRGEWKLKTSDFNMPNNDAVFTITYPRDMVFDSIDLSVGAGILHADALQCRKAEFEVGAGSIEVSSLNCQQECSVDVGAGKFSLSEGTLNGHTEIDCGLGKADLRAARPQNYYLELSCSVGTVTFDGTEYRSIAEDSTFGTFPAASSYEIECSLGSVTVEFY